MEVDRGRLTDIELTENAVAVLKKRYLKKNEQGEAIEGPSDVPAGGRQHRRGRVPLQGG